MTERNNGKAPFTRRTHGSERRGVFPVPNFGYVAQQEQSKRDKARLFEMTRKRLEALRHTPERTDFGNKDLPAYKFKSEIISNVEAYKAVILGGETGSGKSTQLPQYLYEAGYDLTIVMVPRRIIADGLGERIREEFTEHMEENAARDVVGIVHGERSERHSDNKILVMTPNTFTLMEKELRETMGDKKVAIIADEIHEANLFTEIATGVAAMSVRDLDNWRLIAASATHNADTLQSSFQELNGGYVPAIHIEGRPFPVDLQTDPEHTSMEVYAERGHEHQRAMIFTSGVREIDHIIEETINALEAKEEGSSKNVIFRRLHGKLSAQELDRVDDAVPEGYRLVIVSSPAGMSGITISGLTMVITDGTINRQELDEDGVRGLRRHYLSQSEITQEIGRAGRDVGGGIGILAKPTTVADDLERRRGRVITAPQMEYLPFDERPEHAPAEIYSTNLSRVVLSVAALDRQFGDINPYMPHSVKPSAIIAAEESLYRLGALDEVDVITPIGREMNKFPISVELSRGIYEVRKEKRSRQQLARAAFIAAAVDVGGLQDFINPQMGEWKKLVRQSTSDDFIAQLDMMTKLEAHVKTERPLYDFVTAHSLGPKQVERAQKVARKILKAIPEFGLNLDVFAVTPPLPDEEEELRSDFTSGMIDLVYQEAGKSYRNVMYRNIHGDEDSTKRMISDRSVSKPEEGQLVAGIPRWFIKRDKKRGPVQKDILEMTLHVDPKVVGAYALASGLLVGKPMGPRMDGERIVEIEQRMFGSIKVGEPVKTMNGETIPVSSQRVLLERVLENPGPAQLALREIADELENYHERFTPEILAEYKKTNAPAELTKRSILTLIEQQTATTRSLSEIDRKLAQHVYSKNITINRYYDDDARKELLKRSPDTISIAGTRVRVFYENGQPYITQVSREQKIGNKEPVYLKDGREVLLQVAVRGGGKRRISIGRLEVD